MHEVAQVVEQTNSFLPPGLPLTILYKDGQEYQKKKTKLLELDESQNKIIVTFKIIICLVLS